MENFFFLEKGKKCVQNDPKTTLYLDQQKNKRTLVYDIAQPSALFSTFGRKWLFQQLKENTFQKATTKSRFYSYGVE